MNSLIRVLITFSFVVGLATSMLTSPLALANEAAISVAHFKSLNTDINRNPHPVYQQLLDIEANKRQLMSRNAYLWLLYRKAQAENLLYFYHEFESTVGFAATLVEENTDHEVVAALSVFQGVVAQRNGLYDKAMVHFNAAIKLARQQKLNYIYVLAKHEAAYTLTLKEEFKSSLEDMQEAYVHAFAMNDHFLIALINEVYGAIYGYMDDYEKSIEYYQKALDTYERLGYQPYVAEAIYGLATTYRYWKKFDLAIERFEQYREKISYTPNQEISYFGEYGIGMTYAQQGNCDKALPVIDYALTLNGQADYNAELYKKKAICLINKNKLDQAELSLKQANDIFASMPELNGTTWQLETIKVNAMLAYAKGEHEQGFVQLKQYYEANTDLLINNASEKVIEIREAMDLERLDIEISSLKQKEQYQELMVIKKEQEVRLQYALFIFALVAISFIFIVILLQYRHNKKVFALSITDPLTNVFNRRYIFDYLERLVATTSGRRGELSILLFDIDDFKHINDAYGHPFGDQVLRQLVTITHETLRTGDIFGRIGGEEFLSILPRTDSEQAWQVADRLRTNVCNHPFITPDGKEIKITISLGISALGETAQDRASLYIQSDKALYVAKQQGKNQVVIYDE